MKIIKLTIYMIIISIILFSCYKKDLKNRIKNLENELIEYKKKYNRQELKISELQKEIEKYNFFINQSNQLKIDYKYTGIFSPINENIIREKDNYWIQTSNTLKLKVIKKNMIYKYYLIYNDYYSKEKYEKNEYYFIEESNKMIDEFHYDLNGGFGYQYFTFYKTDKGYLVHLDFYQREIPIEEGDIDSEHFFECKMDLMK